MAVRHALTEDGILVAQIDKTFKAHDSPKAFPQSEQDVALIQSLQDVGFETVKEYAEARAGMPEVWKFVIAFASDDAKLGWYDNEAEVEQSLLWRGKKTKDGQSLFRYFDGATMMSYQYPSRVSEEVHCRSDPQTTYCGWGHGFDPERQNAPITSLEVKESKIPGAGRGLFFQKDYPSGTYIAVEQGVHDIMFLPSTTLLIKEMLEKESTDWWEVFEYYLFGYGFSSEFYGGISFSVDGSKMTFINHGCNGTYIMGVNMSITELTAPDTMPAEILDDPFENAVYSPFLDRNHMMYVNGLLDTTLKDVRAGDEVLDNYLAYLNEQNWKDGISDYRAQCKFEQVGAIGSYEKSKEKGNQRPPAIAVPV
jgi:hypothetical protein